VIRTVHPVGNKRLLAALPFSHVRLRDALKGVVPFVWTAAPVLVFEKVAEYYYLGGNPLFYSLSGPRLEVFLLSFFLGSVAAGGLLRKFWAASAVQLAALVVFLFVVYVACDSRVCYSTGADGLEPLRLGAFLGAVAVSGAALGARPHGKWALAVAAGSSFAAVAYYPVIFDFAGTQLLQPTHPWGLLAVVFLAALAASSGTALVLGGHVRLFLPILSLALLLVISVGIAAAYLDSISSDVVLMALAALAGGAVGARVEGRHARKLTPLWGVAVVLVLVMTVFVLPDAVSGVVPAPGGQGVEMGVPVYVGGYMAAQQGHAAGAGVTVTLAGANASSVQSDNFLSAGLGVHSAGCCVDGIDYAYRFDLFYAAGKVSLVATGWEVCDDNVACGGHSWEVLLLGVERPLGATSPPGNVTLRMEWAGGGIQWTYSVDGGDAENFTYFLTPAQENTDFNTGIAGGGSLTSAQSASYFYQFGISSKYPLGRGGWSVEFYCPSVEVNGSWSCIQHAKTVQGGQSFWKVLWRWGEDYPSASVESPHPFDAIVRYSADSAGNFQTLW